MTTAEKLIKVAENVPKVYEAGFEAGKAQGEGDSWYDTFWDNFQDYGNETSYLSDFRWGWNDNNFKPKYDIKIVGPRHKYNYSTGYLFANSKITNLKAILEERGVVLDTSKATACSLWYIVRDSTVTHLPVIDSTNADMHYIFIWEAVLEYVEKLILERKDLQLKRRNSSDCIEINYETLTHMPVEGTFYMTVIAKKPKLDLESAVSFINALENYAGTENEFKYPITFSPTTWGYLDAEGNASPNGNSWREYINDLGWNAS